MSDDDSEMWREHKEHVRQVKEKHREVTVPEIYALSGEGYRVEKLTEYQYRITDLHGRAVDIYPTWRKFHNIKTGHRGKFRSGHLLSIINKQFGK